MEVLKPEGVSRAQVKGVVLRSGLKVLIREYGQATADQVVAATPPRFREHVHGGFIASQWYAESLLIDWYRALTTAVSPEEQVIFGSKMQREMMTGIHRLGVLLASPERALQFSPRGHSMYLSSGRLTAKAVGPQHFVLTYNEMPLVDEPGFVLGMVGAYSTLLELAGAKNGVGEGRRLRSGLAEIDLRWGSSPS
jgi:hypothetical protein